jgi:hypothetical protein
MPIKNREYSAACRCPKSRKIKNAKTRPSEGGVGARGGGHGFGAGAIPGCSSRFGGCGIESMIGGIRHPMITRADIMDTGIPAKAVPSGRCNVSDAG